MPANQAPSSSPKGHQTIADRLIAGGLAAHEVVVIGARQPAVASPLAPLVRSARERFQAITGLGLSRAQTTAGPPGRHRLPGAAGRPSVGYLAAGDASGARVLFIHGTPGEASDWAPFLENVPRGQRRVAVDRPGFGRSGPGRSVVALAEQAGAIARLLEAGEGPAIVVGSSYGGAVALQLAACHPEVVSGVVLVGSAADPAQERIHPVQRVAATRAVRALLPRALASSNEELVALPAELEALGARLGRIRAPVSVLQGLHDTLVPPENATYLAARLVNASRRRFVLVERAGHFLHILASHLVEDALGKMIAEGPNEGPSSERQAGRSMIAGAA